jgi:hypothetical protein
VALVERLAPPPGAVLVRTRADGPDWIDRLPAVPAGRHVTVSVSHPDLRAVPAHLLLQRGYRIVGVHPWRAATDGHGSVDLLVHANLIESAPAWWQTLVAVADRAFDLRLGPVQRVLGDEIALHLAH